MADLEKTIKAMELCNKTDGCGGSKCPYYDETKLDVPCFIKARFDALELLKEFNEHEELLKTLGYHWTGKGETLALCSKGW